MTALGPIRLCRVYFACPGCALGAFPLDKPVGIDGLLSRQARRVLCAAGARKSFEQAEILVRELCGFSISDETIRQACLREGGHIAAWLEGQAAACQPFQKAAGEVEFQTDAAKVNTDDGWRDLKIGIFAKREPGKAATPAEWDTRALPGPSARLAFAAIEASDVFGPRWRAWAARLGITDPRQVSVLADGAEWIWEQTRLHLPGAKELLDIYHACEHLAATGRAWYGADGDALQAWLAAARQQLLADGWAGLCAAAATLAPNADSAERQAALDGLVVYFSKHTGRLNYCARLYGGRSIGSGMVEGACKTAIGQRLKQTGAQWGLGNVGPMASLCCLLYNDAWPLYWTAA